MDLFKTAGVEPYLRISYWTPKVLRPSNPDHRYSRGDNLDESLHRIFELGLTEKVVWINLYSKPLLIEMYNIADVVADQFIVGVYGTSCPEAMSCGKPVLIHLDPKYMKPFFGSIPPHLEAKSAQEVAQQLNLALDKQYRIKLGEKSRSWIVEHHGPNIVGKYHIRIYRQFLKDLKVMN